MPTIKQRITITATGDLEEILAVEARLHPELSQSALVADLIRRGHAMTIDTSRRKLVEAMAGGISYPHDHLGELRSDWSD